MCGVWCVVLCCVCVRCVCVCVSCGVLPCGGGGVCGVVSTGVWVCELRGSTLWWWWRVWCCVHGCVCVCVSFGVQPCGGGCVWWWRCVCGVLCVGVWVCELRGSTLWCRLGSPCFTLHWKLYMIFQLSLLSTRKPIFTKSQQPEICA